MGAECVEARLESGEKVIELASSLEVGYCEVRRAVFVLPMTATDGTWWLRFPEVLMFHKYGIKEGWLPRASRCFNCCFLPRIFCTRSAPWPGRELF